MTHTYSIEAAQGDLLAIARLAAKGEDILLTENNKPLVKLVALDKDEVHRQKVVDLQGFLRGMDTSLDRGQERV